MLLRSAAKNLPPEYRGSLDQEALWIDHEFSRIRELREVVLTHFIDAGFTDRGTYEYLYIGYHYPRDNKAATTAIGEAAIALLSNALNITNDIFTYTEAARNLAESFRTHRDAPLQAAERQLMSVTSAETIGYHLPVSRRLFMQSDPTGKWFPDEVREYMAGTIALPQSVFLSLESVRKLREKGGNFPDDPLKGAMMLHLSKVLLEKRFFARDISDPYTSAICNAVDGTNQSDREILVARFVDKQPWARISDKGANSSRGRGLVFGAMTNLISRIPQQIGDIKARTVLKQNKHKLL